MTTCGTIIPVLVIESFNLTGVRRSFVFPGGRLIVVVVVVVVVVCTVSVAVVPMLGCLETLFHFVIQLANVCGYLLHASMIGLQESGKSDDILFHLHRLVGRSGER